MSSLIPAYGCLFVTRPAGATGSFALSPPIPQDRTGSPILVQGASISIDEVFSKTLTNNGSRILYSFGTMMGDVGVQLTLLLGRSDRAAQSTAWNGLLEYFSQHRLSADGAKPIQLSMPGGRAVRLFVVGLRMSPPDPKFNIASAQLICVAIDSDKLSS